MTVLVALRVPAALEESAWALLAHAGMLGGETVSVPAENADAGVTLLHAYFADAVAAAEAASVLAPLAERAGVARFDFDVREVPATDWNERFRRELAPFALATRFAIDPREAEQEPLGGDLGRRELLRLTPERAFGAGTHESTRLAVVLLERVALAGARVALDGARVVDVGTGTGILALCSWRLGAASIVAFDNDVEAVVVARANASRNGARTIALAACETAALARGRGRADLVIANIVPETILPILAELAELVAPAGVLLLSGILLTREAEVLDRAARLGWQRRDRETEGEWVALLLARVAADGAPDAA